MLLHGRIRRAEEKRGQDDGSDGGAEEGEVRVGALGGAPGEAVWAGGYFIIVGFYVLFLFGVLFAAVLGREQTAKSN